MKRTDTLQANPTPGEWSGMPTIWWKWLHDVYVLLTCQDGRQNFINTLTDSKVDPLKISKFLIQNRYGDVGFADYSGTPSMPYIGPDGELITAVEIIAQKRAITNVGAMRMCQGSPQTFFSGVPGVMTFDTINFDQDSATSPGTGTWTPKQAGLYSVTASVGWAAADVVIDRQVSVSITKNGAFASGAASHTSNATDISISTTDLISVNGTTDYIRANVQHDFGVNTPTFGNNYTCYLAGVKIS